MYTEIASVGSSQIEVTPGHIYLYPHLPATYDYVPWNVVNHVIKSAQLSSPTLIDVGANVGDSLAHYRRFSEGPAICIEPADNFFAVLKRNALKFANVELVKSLLVPDDMVGKVAFSGNEQTGATRISSEGDDIWSGPYITFSDLLSNRSGPVIIKTDTDGFDADIIKSALPHISSGREIPILYFEGPSEAQMRSGDYLEYVAVCDQLVLQGYGLLFLTNVGMPYTYSQEVGGAAAALSALETGYRRGMALCHYYDVIAVKLDLVTHEFALKSPWGDEFFVTE
ncbi:FkbM family methyltransferase [Brevundimonas sp. 1080]|uniref:FkbM family methyltransferase n=1 Tax=Brevundimonas sp. 1080 TaxID=3156405 RepID=UPI003398A535